MQDVPWASLVSDVNTNWENLAPGYVLDLPNAGYVGRTFNEKTYPGLQEKLQQEPSGLDGLPDDAVAFRFHIKATATAMTCDEFISQQKLEALKLRKAILKNKTATVALTMLAADV